MKQKLCKQCIKWPVQRGYLYCQSCLPGATLKARRQAQLATPTVRTYVDTREDNAKKL